MLLSAALSVFPPDLQALNRLSHQSSLKQENWAPGLNFQ